MYVGILPESLNRPPQTTARPAPKPAAPKTDPARSRPGSASNRSGPNTARTARSAPTGGPGKGARSPAATASPASSAGGGCGGFKSSMPGGAKPIGGAVTTAVVTEAVGLAIKANEGRAAHRSELSGQLKQSKAGRKPTSPGGSPSSSPPGARRELKQLELDGTDNWMLYSQASEHEPSPGLSARGHAPKVDGAHVATLIETLGLIPSAALGHKPEAKADRLLEGSAGGVLVPCNRRGHWFPFKALKHAAVELLGPLRPPGVKGAKGLEAYAHEAALQALERVGADVYDFYSRVGFFGAWCELAPRGSDGRPLTTASNAAADARVYALRRASSRRSRARTPTRAPPTTTCGRCWRASRRCATWRRPGCSRSSRASARSPATCASARRSSARRRRRPGNLPPRSSRCCGCCATRCRW